MTFLSLPLKKLILDFSAIKFIICSGFKLANFHLDSLMEKPLLFLTKIQSANLIYHPQYQIKGKKKKKWRKGVQTC